MRAWLARLWPVQGQPHRVIPDPLWQQALAHCPFLELLTPAELTRLRELSTLFLADKEFHGAQGLVITDAMALTIAAQACLPVLHFGPDAEPLRWYDDFIGIVVHPDEVVAQREVVDEHGVVHRYEEALAGEAMHEGPVMLSWRDVTATSVETGYNVVIHEFVHKLDLRDGVPDGCPPLPPGFMGQPGARAARALWLATLQAAYDAFHEAVIKADRFGADPTWLDPYGAEAIDEFFAVTSEAYFVNRDRFGREFETLLPLFDAYFRPGR
ncbi:MAG: zinc-dependent peptidase [Hylemonella sp.]|nr:zinc-dependent peptidase [Hylemonella sp.]